jgi:hypothetical protein
VRRVHRSLVASPTTSNLTPQLACGSATVVFGAMRFRPMRGQFLHERS